jgi:membrane fusion protein, heavy metal efflux system
MDNPNNKTHQEEVEQDSAQKGESHPKAPRSNTLSRIKIFRVIGSNRRLAVVVVLLAISAVLVVALLLSRGSSDEGGRPVPAPTGAPVPLPSGETSGTAQPRPGEVTITLSPGEVENAQIKTEVATEQTGVGAASTGGMRTTGTVQPNAYKEVPVVPVAGGIVRQVNAELGDKVGSGQTLATVFSTDLADAQAAYLKMLAEVEEHHQHHRRTVELVEIGAVSREELEQATSNYKGAQANLSSARQRLILLGMSARQIDALRTPGQVESLISVSAPASGTVISRTVNPGEVIETGKELFRVANLSTVWVIAQVYENDFKAVRLGTPAVITTPAYPGRTFNGRVSYIDPRVDPQTRTAQVRIEVANPAEVLRLGMFVDISFGGTAPTATGEQRVVVVPRTAVQNIGTKQVVYVATNQAGVFIQREVTLGPETNGLVAVYSGMSAGDRVVTEGSFLLRAESLKRNPAQVGQ